MYTSIIWDLDGTLLDTLDDLADSVNEALAQHSMPLRTKDEVRTFVGNGIRNLILRAVPDKTEEATAEAVLETFTSYYKEHMNDKTAPYPGIPALLAKLRAAGVKMAIVSNKADFAAKELAKIYFADLIDVAVGARDGVPKKPFPDAVFDALAEIGAKKEESVLIGDSEVDVQTGKNAGMATVAVSYGFRSEKTLREAGTDAVCESVEALAALLLGERKNGQICKTN